MVNGDSIVCNAVGSMEPEDLFSHTVRQLRRMTIPIFRFEESTGRQELWTYRETLLHCSEDMSWALDILQLGPEKDPVGGAVVLRCVPGNSIHARRPMPNGGNCRPETVPRPTVAWLAADPCLFLA
jgi:hypothetical protein